MSKKKELDLKKILLIALPVLLILILVVVIVKKKEAEETETTSGLVAKNDAALIPDSEEENVANNKLEAYGKEEAERRKKELERRESEVSNQQFFREVTGDVEKPKRGENLEEFYARTVLAMDDEEEEVIAPAPKPKPRPQNNSFQRKVQRKVQRIVDDEPSQVEANYAKATNVPSAKKEVKEEESESTAPRTSLSQRIANKNMPEQTRGRRTRNRSVDEYTGEENLIRACIHGDQTLTNNSSVRMRLLEDANIGGLKIEKNTLFYGVAKISSDRLQIQVKNIKVEASMQSVQFTIYDNDAIEGLNLPDNIKEEIAKRTKDSAIDQVQVPDVGTGLIGGLTKGVGNAVKGVVKKDNQAIKVHLKANYSIYIKEKYS